MDPGVIRMHPGMEVAYQCSILVSDAFFEKRKLELRSKASALLDGLSDGFEEAN